MSLEPLRHKCVCPNDATISDLRTIEDRAAHADEAFVSDCARMDDRRVSDRRVTTYFDAIFVGEMYNGAVLHIAPLSYFDRIDVAPENGAIPDTAHRAEFD